MKASNLARSLLALFLAVLASASGSGKSEITADQLLKIVPKSKTCDNPPAPGECATAEQAAPFINTSFDTYHVTSPAEKAAVISLMAFESDDFKYNKNHFPGRPGQGTRNMQMPPYNLKYAESISELSDKLGPVRDDPSKVLDLLLSDEKYDFGSGAWFLTSHCSSDVRDALKTGSEAGWKKYISDCVGTTATDDRKAYWTRAAQALGVGSD